MCLLGHGADTPSGLKPATSDQKPSERLAMRCLSDIIVPALKHLGYTPCDSDVLPHMVNKLFDWLS